METNKNHAKKALLAIFATLLPLLANAEKVLIDGIGYNLIEKAKRAVVVHQDETYEDTIFIIPSTVVYNGETYSVTDVERVYLRGSHSISVILSEGITHIGEGAFVACWLTEITIPKSIVSIGKSAFRFCTELTSITIPEGIKNIEELTFCYSGLATITLPQSLKSIGEKAFSGCSHLETIDIPNNVLFIYERAFSGCSSLKNINLSENLERIGEYAFKECTSLEEIKLPQKLSVIYDGAFEGCTNLSSIEIPNEVSKIGDKTFAGCISIKDIKMSERISNIGKYAFKGCTNMSSITIPAKVKNIKSFAFSECTNLDTLVILGRTIIDDYAFSECPQLLDVFCSSELVCSAEDRELRKHYGLEDALIAEEQAFANSDIKYATLHAPANSQKFYEVWEPWSNFGKVVPLTEEDFERIYGHQQKDFPFWVLPAVIGLIFVIILVSMKPKKKHNL